jgi:hypothetical protein
MRAKAPSFFQHPCWVATLLIAIAVTVWGFSLYAIGSQIGRPLPSFSHTPDILLHFIPKNLVNTSRAKGGHQPWWQSRQA